MFIHTQIYIYICVYIYMFICIHTYVNNVYIYTTEAAGGRELLMHVCVCVCVLCAGGRELLMLLDKEGGSALYLASQNGHLQVP